MSSMLCPRVSLLVGEWSLKEIYLVLGLGMGMVLPSEGLCWGLAFWPPVDIVLRENRAALRYPAQSCVDLFE